MIERHAVTGAYGYSGQFIARLLLNEGVEVRTLTNAMPPDDGIARRIPACALDFSDPASLRKALEGARVLYNTYWVRYAHRRFRDDFTGAVRNTKVLFRAARDAGVERIVHVSITNPSKDSPLGYFRGKAELEEDVQGLGLSWCILRPAVFFGGRDILINNIAWMLRRFPVFGVFGDGAYRLQPIHVEDFAELAVREGRGGGNRIVDAIGPETCTYRELVECIARSLGLRRAIVSIPPALGYWAGRVVGAFVGDVVLTRDEIRGLMDNLLVTDSPPAGSTRLSEWIREHAAEYGRRYASELSRRPPSHRSPQS